MQKEAVWWLPFPGTRADFSIHNLGGLPSRLQIDLFGPNGPLATHYAEFLPQRAQHFSVAPLLKVEKPPERGGIRLTNLEVPGQTDRSYFVARGRLIDETRGFASPFRFQDTLGDIVNAPGSELHAPAVIFGHLDRILPGARSVVRPHLVLRSTTRVPISVEPVVYGADQEGNPVTWKPSALTLDPLAVVHVDLEEQRRSSKTALADGFAGLRVIHNAGPTDVVAEAVSIEETGKFAFYDPIRSMRLHRLSLRAATSFNLSPQHRSFLILKNTTDEPQRARVRLDYHEGKDHYDVELSNIPPQQIAIVDILGLREGQVPDRDGKVLPLDADFGGAVISSEPGAIVFSDPTFVAAPPDNRKPNVPRAGVSNGPLGGPSDFGDPFFPPSCGRGIPEPPPPPRIRSVKFWLNVFIPRDIPGQTEPAPNHPGQTMINPRFIPGCYLTDNRGFNADVHAYSRLHSEIVVGASGPRVLSEWHHADYTRRIDCQTGDEVCAQQADTSRMHFSGLRGAASSAIQIDLMGSGHDPCTFGAGLVGDVDYLGTMTIDVNARTVNFTGQIEPWPAFEAFATADDGAGSVVFLIGPDPAAGPFSLAGGPTRSIGGTASV